MHKVIELIWKRVISLAKDFSNLSSQQHEMSLIKTLEELFLILNQENGYVSFFLTILNHLNPNCAISLSFLKHVIEKSDLPSEKTLCFIIEQLMKNGESVNCMILFILLSQRFSGHLSESMFSDQLSTLLIKSVLFSDNNSIRIYALLALDGFAITGSIKNAILSHPLDIKHGLSLVIGECENRQKKKNSIFSKDWLWFIRQKKCRIDLSDWNQLEHCAKWSFDHIFGKTEKLKAKMEDEVKLKPKVILDKATATSYCKLSRECLMLRNDQSYFESIRATACVFSGKCYFETLIFTSGIIHIGWSTFQSKFQPELGYGVGDDPYGFGFDTYRSAIWCAGKIIYPSKSKHIQCQPGDVIGSLLDADKRICSFFINGQEVARFKYSKRLEGLFPSFSLSTLQHIQVNFGDQPWYYERRRSNILLKPTTTIIRKRMSFYNNDNVDDLCILCFAEPKSVILLPCKHTEFGHACSKLIKQCPLCRSDIQHVTSPSPSSTSISTL